MNQNKGFFAKLLDFSFSSFVAPQVVGILYVLGLIAGVLVVLFSVLTATQQSLAAGLGTLIGSLFGLLIYVVFLRISLESFIVLIRTAESTRILAENVLGNRITDDLNT